MIRVYFLPVVTINGTEQVAGSEFIHDALLECIASSDVRKLIMDTTSSEHDQLKALAIEYRGATKKERDL